jgi:septin family protein
VTIDPVCTPPAGLQCQYVTDNSITISWDHVEIEEEDEEADTSDDEDYEDVNSSSDFDDGSNCNRMLESKDSVQHVKEIKNKKSVISCYLIDCWMAGNQDSSFIQRSTTETTITLEPLVLGTTYCIQVRAVCNDGAGSSFYSPATPILEAETLEEAERAAHIVRRVSKKCPVGPGIDAYRLPLKKRHGTKTQGVGHYVFGEPSYLALAGKRRQRTILMLGATGSGKSTLINAMVNYVLGVEWDDDFRFKLIDEPANKSQAHSQTDLVTTYDLYEMKGSRLNYSLTVVDTPGFGDTRGLEKDKKIMQQIQDYFQCRHGIQQLEAVCFVVQSSLPRLTATQKYIFDSILSIFGQDIKDNIRLMVTFSDGALPPVLGAVKEAGIPSPMDPSTGLPLHHKFNNSIFFTSNKGDRQTNEFNRTYFDMAVGGFDKFFDDLGVMEAKSLTLTREVLEERKRLEALVEGLQMKTEMKLTRVDELEKIKKILKENEEQMDANQAFEFETLVPKSTDISGTGQFTTNCQNCRTTCHFPCRQAHDNDKHRCSVMDRISGNCMICKCPWNVHFNQKYRYEMVKEKVQRSSDAIRQQYQGAVSEALTNEQLLARIEKEIKKHESQLMELMQLTYPCIQRLDEIALRPHPFSTPDYIDLMIAAEKQEHRSGYQQRIVTLHKLREMANITAKLIRDQQKTAIHRMSSLSLKPKQQLKRPSAKAVADLN